MSEKREKMENRGCSFPNNFYINEAVKWVISDLINLIIKYKVYKRGTVKEAKKKKIPSRVFLVKHSPIYLTKVPHIYDFVITRCLTVDPLETTNRMPKSPRLVGYPQ